METAVAPPEAVAAPMLTEPLTEVPASMAIVETDTVTPVQQPVAVLTEAPTAIPMPSVVAGMEAAAAAIAVATPIDMEGEGSSSKRGRPAGAKVPRWTPEEDETLKGLVAELGEKNWKEVAGRLEHGRSATAVEQHYNIITGKRKKPGSKDPEVEGEQGDEVDEAAKAARLAESAERAAAKAAEREAKAAEKAEEKAKREALKEEREAHNSAKKVRVGPQLHVRRPPSPLHACSPPS